VKHTYDCQGYEGENLQLLRNACRFLYAYAEDDARAIKEKRYKTFIRPMVSLVSVVPKKGDYPRKQSK